MVDASGIPRRVTPETQAQRTNDLARQVQQLGSARPLYPVWGDVYNADANQFNLTPELKPLLTVNVKVPDGFTTALVQATADMNFVNTSTQVGGSLLLVRIDGVRASLARSSNAAHSLDITYVGASYSRKLENIRSSFDVVCEGACAPGTWYSTGDEGVSLSVIVTFLR